MKVQSELFLLFDLNEFQGKREQHEQLDEDGFYSIQILTDVLLMALSTQ